MNIHIIKYNFNSAWAKLVSQILTDGERSIIGDSDDSHPIIELPGMITLKNDAIRQIKNFEIHPDYPFKAIQQYADQFTYDWKEKNGTGGFDYTYFNRLTQYMKSDASYLNQLDCLRYDLEDQIEANMSSNRNHAITWIPEIDSDAESPPCLQSINIRYVGNNRVDIFLYWRSRDAYTAWQSNIIAIIEMLNKYVIKPNDCTIRSYTEFCNSYHIYESDISAASKIRPLNPQINYE